MKRCFWFALCTATLVSLGLVLSACNLSGSSSSSRATANEAIRAIPRASEVIGGDVTTGTGSSFGASALIDNPHLADNVGGHIEEYETIDLTIDFLKAVAELGSLSMNDVNRLADIPTDDFPEGTGIDWPPTVDFGVLQVRETESDTVNIRWVVDFENLGSGLNYLDITLEGWRGDAVVASIWQITDPEVPDNFQWVFIDIDESERAFSEHRILKPDGAGEFKTEKLLFRRRPGGELDAMVSLFETGEAENGLLAFREGAGYTVAYHMGLDNAEGPVSFAPTHYHGEGSPPEGSNVNPPDELSSLFTEWKALSEPPRPDLSEFPQLP
jgi:hypothetical protein